MFFHFNLILLVHPTNNNTKAYLNLNYKNFRELKFEKP